jgi:HAD superfamily hydrolase (TIGR01509 family)
MSWDGTAFDLIVFDLDGVLVDTTACHRRAYDDLWRLAGCAGPAYEVIAGRRTLDVVADVTAPLSPSAAQVREWVTFKQARARHYLAEIDVAYPDTRPCLAALAATRIRRALATGASRETTEIVLARLGARERWAAVVTADDVSAGKPSPDVYLAVIARTACCPERVLIVEDSAAGLAAAAASGAHVVSVRSGLPATSARFLGAFDDLRAVLAKLEVATL